MKTKSSLKIRKTKTKTKKQRKQFGLFVSRDTEHIAQQAWSNKQQAS